MDQLSGVFTSSVGLVYSMDDRMPVVEIKAELSLRLHHAPDFYYLYLSIPWACVTTYTLKCWSLMAHLNCKRTTTTKCCKSQ